MAIEHQVARKAVFPCKPGLVELSEADHERKAVRSGNVGIRVRISLGPFTEHRWTVRGSNSQHRSWFARTGATADPEGTTEERVLSVWDLVWDF